MGAPVVTVQQVLSVDAIDRADFDLVDLYAKKMRRDLEREAGGRDVVEKSMTRAYVGSDLKTCRTKLSASFLILQESWLLAEEQV